MNGLRKVLALIVHPLTVTLALFAALPLVLPLIGGHISLAIEVLIMSIFALAFNLLLGYTGLTSFGHAAYLGLGAYGFALCELHLTDRIWFAPLLSGILLTGIIAFLVGYVISRKRGVSHPMMASRSNGRA